MIWDAYDIHVEVSKRVAVTTFYNYIITIPVWGLLGFVSVFSITTLFIKLFTPKQIKHNFCAKKKYRFDSQKSGSVEDASLIV